MDKETLYNSLSANAIAHPVLFRSKDGWWFEFEQGKGEEWLKNWERFKECHEPACGRFASAEEAVADLYERWPWLVHAPHPHFAIDDSCVD